LIAYTPKARRHVEALVLHYEALGRPEAVQNLVGALDEAERRIDRSPEVGLSAPRPYPLLARPGRRWLKAGRYWVAYRTSVPPVIIGVFFEAANIPDRT
jgi:plasmid stabilization system protein ParE